MAFQLIDTQTGFSLICYRMGSTQNHIVTTSLGTQVNLSGSTFHLWVAVPTPLVPIPLTPTNLVPASGFTATLGKVTFNVTEADLSSWNLPPGNYAAELLCSDDGGVTTDKVAVFTLTVGSWLTNTF